MKATVAVAGAAAADELRSLHEWLTAEEELRGRVRLVQSPPPAGALGSVPEALAVALAPGGAAAVLASAVIAWMRHRSGEVVCKVTRPDGTSLEISAQRVRGTDVAEVRELAAGLARMLDDGAGTAGPGEADQASPSGRQSG